MSKATMERMKERVTTGRDPLTGEPFKTCAPHSVSLDGEGRCVCDGCGRRVKLDGAGAWEHA